MNCTLCEDGLVWRLDAKGNRAVSRCACPAGQKYAAEYFAAGDKEHKYPLRYPVYRPSVSGKDRAAEPDREREAG